VWQHSQPHTLPGAQHPGTISAIRLCSVRLAQPHWKARTALQSIQDRYLTHISGVKYATPSAMLLKIWGCHLRQKVWWQWILEIQNETAASPGGLLSQTALLDSLGDAFLLGVVPKKFLALLEIHWAVHVASYWNYPYHGDGCNGESPSSAFWAALS